jgi:Skp family chaperone for outer membrane proteins
MKKRILISCLLLAAAMTIQSQEIFDGKYDDRENSATRGDFQEILWGRIIMF